MLMTMVMMLMMTEVSLSISLLLLSSSSLSIKIGKDFDSMEAHAFFFENSHRIFSLQDVTEKILIHRDIETLSTLLASRKWNSNAESVGYVWHSF